jgi:hypothetical protein
MDIHLLTKRCSRLGLVLLGEQAVDMMEASLYSTCQFRKDRILGFSDQLEVIGAELKARSVA